MRLIRNLLLLTCLFPFGVFADELYSYHLQFDLLRDNQHVALLDYRFKSGSRVLRAADRARVARGELTYRDSYGAEMPRLTSLFVKWRDLQSGEVHEETAQLNRSLPVDLDSSFITFLILKNQLHVYVVSSGPRTPESSASGPNMYRFDPTVEVYPAH